MMRKHCFIFFVYFSCLLLKCSNQTNKLYVCPIKEDALSKMVQYRYQLLCNSTSVDCALNQEFYRDLYNNFVILQHDGDWSLIKNITEHLSGCKIKYVLVDVNVPFFDFGSPLCAADRSTLIFSLISSNKVALSNEDCTTRTLSKRNKLIQSITSVCPNTVWFTGTINCFNMTSYGERFLSLNSEGEVITDKSLGKTLLKGKTLRLGMIVNAPYYFETGPTTHSGMLHNLVEKISNNLQFNYTVHYPKDKQYGGQNETDGTWSGMVGDLINNKTDAIFADLTVTFPRSQYIDFTSPYYFESIGILIRQPELDSKLWKMFSLFPSVVWLTILATVVISSFVLYGLHLFSPLPIESPFNKLSECFWCTISCFANQGSEYDPETWSVQNFMALFWLYVFAMLSIYSGGLIAMLTSSRMALPFKDLEGLSLSVKQGQFKVCVAAGTAFHTTVMAGAGLYAPIKEFLNEYPSYQSNRDTCVDLLKKSTVVAFLEEITYLEGVQNDNCNKFKFILLNDKFFPGYFSIGLPKNSSLNGIFSEELTMAVDGGLIQGWKKNFTADSLSFCKILQPDAKVSADSNDLSLTEFAGPFVLLGIGIAASILGFLFEFRRIIFKKKRSNGVLFDNIEKSERRKRRRNNWIKS